MAFTLPPLPYDYSALEPHIDAQTMKLHHDIHHLAYVNGLNNAEAKLAEALKDQTDEDNPAVYLNGGLPFLSLQQRMKKMMIFHFDDDIPSF